LLFYFTSYVFNMFRTLIYPSSGACDCAVELPHWSYCSWFDVCWSFGVDGLEWYPCCKLQPATRILLASCQQICMTLLCVQWKTPDNGQRNCPKHVEVSPSWSCSHSVSKPVWHIPLLCVEWKTPDDWQRNCPKHVEFSPSWSCSQAVSMTYTTAVCTVKIPCWLTEELSETCSFLRPDPARKLSAWHIPLLCVQWKTPDNGQRNCPKHVEFFRPDPARKVSAWHIPLLCVQWKTPDNGQRNCPKHVEFFRPDPARKLSANLYDIYHCCVYSEKLLMMDRGTVRNM